MLYRAKPGKVFFYGKAVDFRKQTAGLAAIVDSELPGQLSLGHWFVFISNDKKKAKILYWRGNGAALWQLKLEREVFKLGSPRETTSRVLSWQDLGRLLDGYNIFGGQGHEIIKAKRFA